MDAMEKLWHTILILCICKPLAGSGYTPTDNYLIACGSNSNTTSGRLIFTPDGSTSSVSIKTDKDASAKANRTTQNLSAIYLTARVFLRQSSYSFKIKQGTHWVRLHFFPFSGSGYNLTTAVFSVSTDKFGLLSNFQLNDSSSSVLKEYLINTDTDPLTLTFIPSNDSFAFINAIEVVSAPDNLIPNEAQSVPLVSTFSGLSGHALQTIHRLNMGRPLLSPDNDTLGRFWYPDSRYLADPNGARPVSVDADTIIYKGSINSDFAPNKVYATAEEMSSVNTSNANYNISWQFDVDPGYQYFVRMHFCDIVSNVLNDLYFSVYINDYTAISSLDLSNKLGVLRAAYYADFVTPGGLKTLYVKVGPDTTSNSFNAILNGLEILKLSNSQSSLDGAFAATSTGNSKNKTGAIIGSVVGSICVLGLLSVIYFLCCRPKCNTALAKPSWLPLPQHGGHSDTVISKESKASATSHASSGQTGRGRLFTFSEIQEATKNFDESLIIGVGGFGKVYKGILEDGTVVAIKRGNPSSEQGIAEFRTEIELLSKLRHRHLVSLIGFCEERCEMILVYEYMANGPLRSHLYGNDNLKPLSWKLRLDICIGAARGLHYLHTGAEQGIIHRDVKTTNILLDENFVAKVADFGLSKTGPSLDQTHVSTAVKGSFGYLDPEYFRRQQLTEKSDVYSFGVVLMEVLCARPAINPALPRDQVNIAEWAMHWQRRGILEQIIDRNLVNQINLNSLRKYGETAEKCLADEGVDRPSMGDVLWNLEYALQLQETAMLDDPDEASTNRIGEIPMSLSASQTIDNSMVEKNSFVSVESSDSATTNTVFSQLANPQGR